MSVDPAGHSRPSSLGGLVQSRRDELGLSLREAARRIDISPSYLSALEHGRSPSTGRAPMPSPRILGAIGRVLGLDLATLLEVSGVPRSTSAHLLLYQMGSGHLSPLQAARRVFDGQVEAWIEIIDPRAAHEAAKADHVLVRASGPLGLELSESPSYAPDRALSALAEILAKAPRRTRGPRLGLIFGANSMLLRSIANPAGLLESEATWERDVAAACQTVLGVEPAANVCVYRETDLQELAARVDPLSTALSLIQSHPHVAVQEGRDAVTIGPAAIRTILAAARPAGINSTTWASLATAAAIGLTRDVAAASRFP